MASQGKIVWSGSTTAQSLPILRKIHMCLHHQGGSSISNDGNFIFSTPLLVIRSERHSFSVEIFTAEFFQGIGNDLFGDGSIEFAINMRNLVSLLHAVLVSELTVCFSLRLMKDETSKLEVYSLEACNLRDGERCNFRVLVLDDAKRINSHPDPSVMPDSYVVHKDVRRMFDYLKSLYEEKKCYAQRKKYIAVRCSTKDAKKELHRVSVYSDRPEQRKYFKFISGDTAELGGFNVWPFDFEKIVAFGGPRYFSGAPQPTLYLNEGQLVAEFKIGELIAVRSFYLAPEKEDSVHSSDSSGDEEDKIDTQVSAVVYEKGFRKKESDDDMEVGYVDYGGEFIEVVDQGSDDALGSQESGEVFSDPDDADGSA